MTCPIPAPVLPTVRNILYPTDFSERSLTAVPYIHLLTGWFGAAVHLVHVVPLEPALELPLDFPPELDGDRNAALTEIKGLLAAKPFGAVSTSVTVERGQLWKVLAPLLEEKHADLVVAGTRGRGGLGKVVLGSFAEQIFRQCRLPVMTVGPHCAERLPLHGKLRTVLFATDFSVGAERALAWAASLCRAGDARLMLVHAVSPGVAMVPSSSVFGSLTEYGDEMIARSAEEARGKLDWMLSDPVLQGIPAETRVEVGGAADTILQAAAETRAGLIVMGARHSEEARLASHIPWATASTVARRACCPVLTVRS